MTSVVVADDQELVRSGLEMVLAVRGVEVLGSAADGREAVELVRRHRPDVVLMDIRMPVLDGIAATRRTLEQVPDTRVMMLTTFDLDEYVVEAFRAGASGFVLKTAPPGQLVAAVRTIVLGEALLAPSSTRQLIEQSTRRVAPSPVLASLSTRETDVLRLLARGRRMRRSPRSCSSSPPR